MNVALRRLPGFAIAIVALALSASLVFAGQPLSSNAGISNAPTHAGKTVPVKAEADDQEGADQEGADQDTETETDQTDPPEVDDSGSADNCTVDLTQDPSVLLTLNHGSVVCSAAHATTWDTTLYPNKGAWVSHWAKLNHGHDPNKSHGHNGGG